MFKCLSVMKEACRLLRAYRVEHGSWSTAIQGWVNGQGRFSLGNDVGVTENEVGVTR
jgi:hypothetical protein